MYSSSSLSARECKDEIKKVVIIMMMIDGAIKIELLIDAHV